MTGSLGKPVITIKIINNNFQINENPVIRQQPNTQTKQNQPAGSFQEVLNNQVQVQFSKHANLRLSSRNIQLTSDQMKRVADGVLKAREKGIQDSLVMVDNVALVVNVNSKTVITAMNSETENIFTNIDGAVIV